MLCKMLPHQILCHRPNQSLSIVFSPGHSARHITMGYASVLYIQTILGGLFALTGHDRDNDKLGM